MQSLLQLIHRHKSGESVGVYSVCSAHPWVLESALRFAKERETHVLIEATSNQQYLPEQAKAINAGCLSQDDPNEWVMDKIRQVLSDYAEAYEAEGAE